MGAKCRGNLSRPQAEFAGPLGDSRQIRFRFLSKDCPDFPGLLILTFELSTRSVLELSLARSRLILRNRAFARFIIGKQEAGELCAKNPHQYWSPLASHCFSPHKFGLRAFSSISTPMSK